MTPKQFVRAGRGLYGENWKSPLARALGMSYQQVWNYARGAAEIPRTVDLAVNHLRDNPGLAEELAAL